MTKLTDDRLRELAGCNERNVRATRADGLYLVLMARELLLLRAECRAAREMREYLKKFTFTLDPRNRVVLYDTARKATDDGGFSP